MGREGVLFGGSADYVLIPWTARRRSLHPGAAATMDLAIAAAAWCSVRWARVFFFLIFYGFF